MDLLLTLDRLSNRIPDSDWLRFGILLLVLLALLQAVKLLTRVNRYVILFVLVVGGMGLLASWVHNRNEPVFLKPLIDIVEPYFPTGERMEA
ncbi:hypothetical protein [Congregicoccus parvus]|jgi:hypothetical protein|uniref:hypothetical protein n=1 Tax=Congregicoccus parvus TaxID=3081749 RepID=UPI003FA56B97